jgi:hypothetical protein
MLYVPEIRSAFPNARFLVLVRDPRDVVLSIANYGWTGTSITRLLRTAIAWQWHMRLLARLFANRDDGLFLRYEDIVTDLAGTLDRINSFLGLELAVANLDDAAFGVMRASNSSYGSVEGGIHSASLGRWRDKMPKAALPQTSWLLDRELAHFGYDRDASVRLSSVTRLKLELMRTAYEVAKAVRHAAFPLARR